MESRWGRELMVSSSAYSPREILSDETPGERSGYTNLLPYRCCWLGAEGEAVVQDLVFGGDKCITRNLNIFLCILYKIKKPQPCYLMSLLRLVTPAF